MQNGKINPVSGIFLGKNNFGYQDKQEMVITPNTNNEPDYDVDAIKKRLSGNSPTLLVDSSDSDEWATFSTFDFQATFQLFRLFRLFRLSGTKTWLALHRVSLNFWKNVRFWYIGIWELTIFYNFKIFVWWCEARNTYYTDIVIKQPKIRLKDVFIIKVYTLYLKNKSPLKGFKMRLNDI